MQPFCPFPCRAYPCKLAQTPQVDAIMPITLTIGSLHYDIMVEAEHLPRPDETAIGSRWYPKFGGKGGNQAVAAA